MTKPPGYATADEAIRAARLIVETLGPRIIVLSQVGVASQRFFTDSPATQVRKADRITHTVYRNGTVEPYSEP